MSRKKQETLSALYDDETTNFETQRLLQGLTEEDKATWQRYQVMRMAMDGSLKDKDLSFDVSQKVAEAIANEPAPRQKMPLSAGVPSIQSRFKPLVGMAAAASVVFFVALMLDDDESFVASGQVNLATEAKPSAEGVQPVSATLVKPEQGEEALSDKKDEGDLESQ